MKVQPFATNVPIQGTKQNGFSHIYRHSTYQKQIQRFPNSTPTTLRSLFEQSFLNKHPNDSFLGCISPQRSIADILTYKQAFQLGMDLGSAILHSKLASPQHPQHLSTIGIYCKNRRQFYMLDIASVLYGFTTVPFYDTLGDQNLQHCVLQSGITACLCTYDCALKLTTIGNSGNLKTIIILDQVKDVSEIEKRFKVIGYEQLMKVGQENRIDYHKIENTIDRCVTISYTSGTTGLAKGAIISEMNIIAFYTGFQIHFRDYKTKEKEVHLSVLPLAHLYERMITFLFIFRGSFIVMYSGNPLKLLDDLMLVKPTLLALVPRIYNKFIQLIIHKLGGESNLLKMLEDNRPQLQGIRHMFGGRVTLIITGSAPILPKYQQMFARVMGCPFIEAYGQTENTAAAFIMPISSTDYGYVGVVLPNLQFKLCDLPEMGYLSTDCDENKMVSPRGEVWLRGPAITRGYYRDEANTKEALSEDGWLRTGDVAVIMPKGLRIIDRKKNIFKLSQGEYVASEKVQHVYMTCPFVAQCFLYGDSLKDHCVVIVVVNKGLIEKLKEGKDIGELCADGDIRRIVLKKMNEIGKEKGLKGFELAKNIKLQTLTFIERQIVSSTLKLQRFLGKKVYQDAIEDMYKEGVLQTN